MSWENSDENILLVGKSEEIRIWSESYPAAQARIPTGHSLGPGGSGVLGQWSLVDSGGHYRYSCCLKDTTDVSTSIKHW